MAELRAAVYTRISRNPDGASTGVDRQEQDCRDVVDRNGWSLVDVYTDDDVSAFSGKERPAWTRMLRDAGSGRIDVVVAWHDDRLWRNVVEQQTVFAMLAGYGVQHVQVGGRTYDTASADDTFISAIQALVAQKESADKSRRLTRQRQELAAEGKPHVGGRRPFGYERDMVTVRESEAVLIREMVERYLAGATTNQLAHWLNETEVPTVSGKVGTWRSSTINGLIGGPRIAGLRAHRGDIIGPASWPAIIDIETHERIRARMGDPRRRQHDSKRSRLLSGLLTCGQCGERMSAKRERTLKDGPRAGRVVTAGYYCSTTSSRDGCGRRAIRALGLEAYISEMVLAAIATPATAGPAASTASDGDRRGAASLTASLQADQHRLDDLAEAFADGAIDRSQLVAGTEKIRARMDATRRQIRRIDRASILTELPTDGAAVVALWEGNDIAWRRQVVSALIETIEIGPGIKRPGFQPERVGVRWRA